MRLKSVYFGSLVYFCLKKESFFTKFPLKKAFKNGRRQNGGQTAWRPAKSHALKKEFETL